MDDLHLTRNSTLDSQAYRPQSLQRTHSWPPALSVGNSAISTSAQSPQLLPRPELVRNVSSSTSLAAFESISSRSSSDLASEVEQKKEGFRAIVSKRWIQTKQVLHEKAKLYREQHRARHHNKAHDAFLEDNFGTKVDEMARAGLTLKPTDKKAIGNEDVCKADSDKVKKDSPKKEAEKKDSEKSDCEGKDGHKRGNERKDGCKKEAMKRETSKSKSERHGRKEKITNSPHELSLTVSHVDSDRDRGRRGNSGGYPSAFSSHGELLYDAHQRRKRKSRTSSGRRHSWRVPSEGIVPVYEETASAKEAMGCSEDNAEMVAQRRRGGRKSTM